MALTGIKFRANPTTEQKRVLSQWMGCARFIYNAKCDDDHYYRTFLSKNLSLTGVRVPVDQTYAQYKTELTPWLNDCPAQVLRNSAVNWYQAYQKYFQGLAGRPKRKKKGNHASVYLTSELFRFDDGKLFIGTKRNNIGHLSYQTHRDFELPRSITISRTNGDWFVSFCYEDGAAASRNPIERIGELAAQGEPTLREVTDGLDRGVVKPLQSATGEIYDFTPEQKASIAREQKKIRKNQRWLARQQKGSSRRERTKTRIGRAHEKIANVRKDFAHKTSRALADGNAQLFIAEDLKLKNMTAKPAAKTDGQGRYLHNRARAKAGLNAALLNAALGSMIIFLAYKAAKANKVVIKLPPHGSSQECAKCGHTHPDNRQTQDKFVCQNCGYTENADLNAAQVMRKRGIDKILSASSSDWRIESDHTVILAAESTRGTRGRARGENSKTRAPSALAQSQRSANLVVVAQAS